jgi:CheY-like chemotaxis protein
MDALNGFRVLVVTDVAQETQHQALAAGYQAFIAKPFDINELLWIVAGKWGKVSSIVS